MAGFVIRTILPDITAEVRGTLLSPQYGHPVHREVAKGTGPCRECLQQFRVGEDERLLFTFNPFDGSDRLPQPGPVFIHAKECELAARQTYPAGLRGLPVMVEVHHTNGVIPAPRVLDLDEEDETLGALLDDSIVSFLHLRHGEAGCYIARVDRLSS